MLDEFFYDHHFTKHHKAFDISQFSIHLQNKSAIHMWSCEVFIDHYYIVTFKWVKFWLDYR